MADDALLEQMKRWGNAQATRFACNDDGPSAGDSVLARQRDLGLAYKRKQQDERKLIGRSGVERRRFMATKTNNGSDGKLKLSIIPAWAVDPIPSRNDAGRPRDNPAVVIDLGVPDELRWIDRALSKLWREFPLRALVLREEFTTSGSQAEKAKRVEEIYDGSLTARQYSRELERALDWMRGKAAA
jgi:hypothetical protein